MKKDIITAFEELAFNLAGLTRKTVSDFEIVIDIELFHQIQKQMNERMMTTNNQPNMVKYSEQIHTQFGSTITVVCKELRQKEVERKLVECANILTK